MKLLKLPSIIIVAVALPLSFPIMIKISGEACSPDKEQEYIRLFTRVDSITTANSDMWGKNIYGPVLLVNPASREYIANYNPDDSSRRKSISYYTGTLPADMHIYNTTKRWKGRNWAMVMLPLSNIHKHDVSVIIHELSHVHLQSMGFPDGISDMEHLADKMGRILLRIELELLKKLLSGDLNNRDILQDAFVIRKLRYNAFPQKKGAENSLELNEGLAEYSAMIMSGFTEQEIKSFYLMLIENYISKDNYDRAFAYITIPVYGYLYSRTKKLWTREISPATDLTNFFSTGFAANGAGEPVHHSILKPAYTDIVAKYSYESLVENEYRITAAKEKLADSLTHEFITKPHLEISFQKMSFTSTTRATTTIRKTGIYYSSALINDDWGELNITGGGIIMSKDFRKAWLKQPVFVSADVVKGDGYILKLKSPFTVQKVSESVYELKEN